MLARLLKGYRIKPGPERPDGGNQARGYHRKQFEDVWRRYL